MYTENRGLSRGNEQFELVLILSGIFIYNSHPYNILSALFETQLR